MSLQGIFNVSEPYGPPPLAPPSQGFPNQPPPYYYQTPVNYSPYPQDDQGDYEYEKPRKPKKDHSITIIMLIIIVIAIIAIVIGFIVFYLRWMKFP